MLPMVLPVERFWCASSGHAIPDSVRMMGICAPPANIAVREIPVCPMVRSVSESSGEYRHDTPLIVERISNLYV